MTRRMFLSLLVVSAVFLSAKAQDGNECSCAVMLEQEGAEPEQLYKESTSIVGSLCTDADLEFCSQFCKKEMAAFTGNLDAMYAPTNVSVGQSLCDMAKKPVAGGIVKLVAFVCDQEARDIDAQQPLKLCCDKTVRWEPCKGGSSGVDGNASVNTTGKTPRQ
uniref:Secreted protein n=1 Tax=Rhipicephalus appendiculatus TaxID=34631 RepID=A0A131Z0H1_RHIAP